MPGGAVYLIPALQPAGAHGAGSWEQHKQLPQPPAPPLPLLVSSYRFPSSLPVAEGHFPLTPEPSWSLYWSTSVLAFSEKGWLQLQCIHSSDSLLLLQWEGKEGHRAEVSRVVSSEKMPGTGTQATRSLEEASCSPSGSSKPRSKPEQFPVSAAPNGAHGERAALMSRVWCNKTFEYCSKTLQLLKTSPWWCSCTLQRLRAVH